MRCHDHLIKLEQRMICRWRFLFENIKRRAGYNSRLDRFIERVLVNQSAAGAVDDARALLHFCKRFATDDAASFIGQWGMHRKEVGAGKDFVQRSAFYFKVAGLLGSDERIVRNDLHPERARPHCHRAPNAAQTNDPQSLALQLRSDEALSLPLRGFYAAVRLRNVAGESYQ